MIHLSCILWLFLSVWRLESVRPIDTEATPKVQQNASFVEVSATHFSHAKLGAKETHGLPVPAGAKRGNQLAGEDEWESDGDEDDVGQQKDILGDQGDNLGGETGPREEALKPEVDPNAPREIEVDGEWTDTDGKGRPIEPPKEEETAANLKPYSYQTPPEGEENQRDPSLGAGPSTGSPHLDALGEQDHLPPPPPIAVPETAPAGPNLLYVPPGPEMSHEEREERLGRGEDLSDVDKRENHFQELLHHRPEVDAAVESYKKGIRKLKETGKTVYEGLDTTDKKMAQLNSEVDEVQKETGNTKRALHAESREAAVKSVDSFANYNKEGAMGEDEFGKFVPDAGKWDVFKDLLDESKQQLDNSLA
jgi:hypothetical protein